MKKKLVLIFISISVIGLSGCSAAKAEKGPVVVNETTQKYSDEITITDEKSDASTDRFADNSNEKDSVQQNNLPSESESFESTIELEGNKESIICKTYTSKSGYQIDYDIDRFTVTSNDAGDSFTAENPDPEVYPYVYLSVNRHALTTEEKNAVSIPKNASDIEEVTIGEYKAKHYKVTEGMEWNSTLTEFYSITDNQYMYEISLQYFTEAAEGYGARLKAMLNTFKLMQ